MFHNGLLQKVLPVNQMSFEENLSRINSHYFFREFTFSKTQFKPSPQSELELADSLIWLDGFLIIFQIKERNAPGATTPQNEERWFKESVIKAATRQIRATLSYLETYPTIEVRNHWGHVFNIASANINRVHKLVVYDSHEFLPSSCTFKKYHRSKTAGTIHIVHAADYLGVLQTLITPVEVADYFAFRERLIATWEDGVSSVPEQALVGQYLRNLPDERPSAEFVGYLNALNQKSHEWDIANIIHLFAERRTTPQRAPTDYYNTLTELATLNRTDMREFKRRFALSMEKANGNESVRPYRFVASTGCGFVFVPLQKSDADEKHALLEAFTALNKYDLRLSRSVGLTFVSEGSETWCDVQWCRIEEPWKENPVTERFLQENSPLRPVTEGKIERYGLLPKNEET